MCVCSTGFSWPKFLLVLPPSGWKALFPIFFVCVPFSREVTDGVINVWNCLNSQFYTDIKLLSTGQGWDDGWSCCNFHVQDSQLSESNILCRHTVATLRLFAYNQLLLLHGQILLVFLWSLEILIEPYNIIRFVWPSSIFHLHGFLTDCLLVGYLDFAWKIMLSSALINCA